LKTKLKNFGLASWHLLTEVPGWPDAPRWMRWRRALPIIIPCAAILLLVIWNATFRDPHIRAERAVHQPLFSLEEEIATLRLNCSEQHAAELATKSAAVADLLLGSPAELGPLLQTFKKEAVSRNWEGNFQAGDASAETPDADAQVIFLPVRGKLASPAGNPGSFPALLALLERYSSTGKRIDLTRLAIRADEQGRYAVELNLRLACRRPHEKTAQ
jgi:hypothetical protein